MRRQKEVLEQIVKKKPFSDLGISLAVGKNFASSAHTDLDGGFTFSGNDQILPSSVPQLACHCQLN